MGALLAERAPVIQRQLLPSADAIDSEFHYNGPESVRQTLSTLFHRLHSAGRLRQPNGEPFPDVTTALGVVLLRPRTPGGKPTLMVDMYNSIVDKSSSVKAESGARAGAVPIRAEDWSGLAPVVKEAVGIAARCAGNPEMIEAVFGPRVDPSGPIGAFKTIAGRLDGFTHANFVVNYGSADDATGAGGASRPGSGTIEVSGSLIKNIASKKATAIVVLVHEAAHETNPSIIDLGYSGSAGFETMLTKDKLSNADHYAELADRLLGTSRYGAATFLPKSGVLSGTAAKDLLRKRVKAANDGLEKIWSVSLSVGDTLIPRLVPGIDLDTGERRGRAETAKELHDEAVDREQDQGRVLAARPRPVVCDDPGRQQVGGDRGHGSQPGPSAAEAARDDERPGAHREVPELRG